MNCRSARDLPELAIDPLLAQKTSVCDDASNLLHDADGVYINALDASLPACTLREAKDRRVLPHVQSLDAPAERCYIYCAKDTCNAAVRYMNANRRHVDDMCKHVVYLHKGAKELPANELVDGDKCHADVR